MRLRAEVSSEMAELARVRDEVQALANARDNTSTYAIALLLMNYYTGAERIFRRIAAQLGGMPPAGDRWHAQLLEDMALDLSSVRPAVLSREAAERLSRLLRLRHVLRNLYAWTVRREELDSHVSELERTHQALADGIARFDEFLTAVAEHPEF
jgi:hypothetical protein